jgi:hypothetical protein
MTDDELVRALRAEDEKLPWTGPDGLFQRAAARIVSLTDQFGTLQDAYFEDLNEFATLRAELARLGRKLLRRARM